MSDATNIKIGACSVVLGTTNLGHTKGGVEVTYSPEYADITADQFGNTVIDKALIGEAMTVKVPLTESQVANLAIAMPLGELDGATDGRLTIGKDAGARLAAEAAKLVLHPLVNAANDLSDDIVIHKAVVHGEVVLPFMVDEQRVIEVEFIALIDTTKSTGNYLGHMGDSTD